MQPITRKEMYLAKISGDYSGAVPEPVTRMDYYMSYAAGAYHGPLPRPIVQQEFYWAYICGVTDINLPEPVTRVDIYLGAMCGGMLLLPEPITREEVYLHKIAKQSQYVVKSAEGKTIVLTDSLEAPFEDMRIFGRSEQVTTTGAQLMDLKTNGNDVCTNSGVTYYKNADGSYTRKGTATTVAGNVWLFGKYKADPELEPVLFTIEPGSTIFAKDCALYTLENGKAIGINTDVDAYLVEESYFPNGFRVTGVRNKGFEVGKAYDDIVYPMVNIGDHPLPWEPYTGGKPSPSPEYPQPIINAGAKYRYGNNLADASAIRIGKAWNDSADPAQTTIVLPCKSLKTYSISITGNATSIAHYWIEKSKDNKNVTSVKFQDTYTTTTKREAEFIVIQFNKNDISEADFADMQIMLNEGTSVLPWEPYTGGIPEAYDGSIGVDVLGGNLLPLQKEEVDLERNGLRLQYKDGRFIITGTSVSNTWFNLFPNIKENTNPVQGLAIPFKSKGLKVKLFGKITNAYGVVFKNDIEEGYPDVVLKSEGYSDINFDLSRIYIYIEANKKVSADFRIAIASDGKIDYEPYRQPQTLTVSTPNGLPGIQVDSGGNYTDETGQQWVCDEVDFDRGVYVQRVKAFIVDEKSDFGSMNHYATLALDTIQPFRVYDNLHTIVKSSAAYCDKLIFRSIWNKPLEAFFTVEKGVDFSILNERLGTNAETSDKEAEAALKQWLVRNPLRFLAQLITPIETPLSPEELAAYRALHTNSSTTVISNNAGAWMKVGYKAKPISQYSEPMTLEYLKEKDHADA